MGAALGAALVLPGRRRARRVRRARASASLCPSCCSASCRRCGAGCRRPGAWMARFQRILSVPMFLTALGPRLDARPADRRRRHGAGPRRRAGARPRLWWLGRGGRWLAWARPARRDRRRRCCCSDPRRAEAAPRGEPARRRAVQRGAARRSCAPRGTPVFVYFTADWCLTCKVNERGALRPREVADAFRARGIKVLVGDWTRGDAAIGRFLEATAAPASRSTSITPPGGGAEVLPQILTAGRLTGARRLTRAAPTPWRPPT